MGELEDDALRGIEDLFGLEYVLGQLVNGLLIGSVYALMAVGITLIFGVMDLVNFAHGEFYMIGGYLIYFATQLYGLAPLPCLVLSFAAAFLVGQIFERFFLRPMYTVKLDRPFDYGVILTFGISIFLKNSVLVFTTSQYKAPPDIWGGTVNLAVVQVSAGRFVAGLSGILILLFFLFFLKRTWTGKAIQATAQNRDGARMLGINTTSMISIAWSVGCGLAGAAGGLLAPVFLVYPNMGQGPAMKAFVIVVLGGLGSVKGSIIGALILGVIEVLGSLILGPAYRDGYAFLVLIVVLLVRPRGLFGAKERRV